MKSSWVLRGCRVVFVGPLMTHLSQACRMTNDYTCKGINSSLASNFSILATSLFVAQTKNKLFVKKNIWCTVLLINTVS